MKLRTLFILITSLFLGMACGRQAPENTVLIKLQPSTYTDEITLDGTVEAVNSTTINSPSRIDGTIIFLVENGTQVEKGDTVCIMENRETDNYYETILSNVEKAKANYNKSKANLEMNYALLEAQLSSIEAQTSITNLDSVQLNYISPVQKKIKELQLQIAGIEKAKYERKLAFLKRINESELKKLQLQIKRDENRAQFIKSIFDEMIMVSTQGGLALRATSQMNDENKVQEGDQVWPGVPIVNIPDLSAMKVMIMASETDYKRLAINDTVFYVFDAMPGNMAWGKIKQIAPMGKPISRNSKIKEFELTASIDSFIVLPEPGLSAKCRVIIHQVPDTIVVPQLAIFEEDSIKIVYVNNGSHFRKQEVLLGISSPKEAVIIAGLEGNETISLVKPSPSKISTVILLDDTLKQKLINPNSDTIPVESAGPLPLNMEKRVLKKEQVINQ